MIANRCRWTDEPICMCGQEYTEREINSEKRKYLPISDGGVTGFLTPSFNPCHYPEQSVPLLVSHTDLFSKQC